MTAAALPAGLLRTKTNGIALGKGDWADDATAAIRVLRWPSASFLFSGFVKLNREYTCRMRPTTVAKYDLQERMLQSTTAKAGSTGDKDNADAIDCISFAACATSVRFPLLS